ncbi:hypothetical protein C8Q80DRAFT_99922 [Daedaleopsis nitida]|nr:hypothetical protein C8Q80DRAFT_99922 [Daedaleopsis nitida]
MYASRPARLAGPAGILLVFIQSFDFGLAWPLPCRPSSRNQISGAVCCATRTPTSNQGRPLQTVASGGYPTLSTHSRNVTRPPSPTLAPPLSQSKDSRRAFAACLSPRPGAHAPTRGKCRYTHNGTTPLSVHRRPEMHNFAERTIDRQHSRRGPSFPNVSGQWKMRRSVLTV